MNERTLFGCLSVDRFGCLRAPRCTLGAGWAGSCGESRSVASGRRRVVAVREGRVSGVGLVCDRGIPARAEIRVRPGRIIAVALKRRFRPWARVPGCLCCVPDEMELVAYERRHPLSRCSRGAGRTRKLAACSGLSPPKRGAWAWLTGRSLGVLDAERSASMGLDWSLFALL